MPLLSDGELLDDESRSGMPGGFFRGGNFEGIEEIGRGNMEIYGKEVGDGGKFQSLFWEISGRRCIFEEENNGREHIRAWDLFILSWLSAWELPLSAFIIWLSIRIFYSRGSWIFGDVGLRVYIRGIEIIKLVQEVGWTFILLERWRGPSLFFL